MLEPGGFLDRLAARAVGEAPLAHPRVRAHFEPGAGVLPSGGGEVAAPAAEVGGEREVVETRRPVVPQTFEPEARSVAVERGTVQPAVAAPPPSFLPTERPLTAHDEVSEEPEEKRSRLRRNPHPLTPSPTRTPTRAEEGEPERKVFISSPPLPGEGSADGRGGRGERVHRDTDLAADAPAASPLSRVAGGDGRGGQGVRGHEAVQSAELLPVIERSAPPPLRPRSARTAELPTVEPHRHAPLPPALEAGEPSETVVQVSIGRIDVRASQPPAPAPRAARPLAGPRLTLENYLKRREERRR